MKDIMVYYTQLVEYIGEFLGPDYEVVLFDLRSGKGGITAISNGMISGRSIGDPLTDFILKKIAEKDYLKRDFITNYKGIVRGNKFIRCATKYIKDEDEELLGLFCINFDDSRYERVASEILKLCHPDAVVDNVKFEKTEEDNYYEPEQIDITITDLAMKLIENTLKRIDKPIEDLNAKEKMSIVAMLNEKDLFELKSSIQYVSKQLNISEATLYRYINNINKSEE